MGGESRHGRRCQFKSWLAGKPAAPTGQIAPTRRAFQWVKGTVRWVKSPLGKQFQNDEIPDELEIDDAEGCDFTQSSTDCAAPIWQDGSATCDTPLCDQADVEAEADSWANVWQEGREYLWQHDQERLARLTPPELRAAAKAFPRDM